jgi:pimeloyl-ACP methyl ester carboxylesterase
MTHADADRQSRLPRPLAALLFAIAAALWSSVAAAQVQDSAQQKCINGLNKSGLKVAATQAKEGQGCLGAAAKGVELNAQACLTADAKGKVAKAQAGTDAADGKCTTTPSFGKTNALAINNTAKSEQVGLVADLFGADLTAAVLKSSDNAAGAKCQAAVLKGSNSLTTTLLKSFLACKKDGLKSTVPGEQIASAPDLGDCFDVMLADASGKIKKAEDKFTDTVAKTCTAESVALATAFPGPCAVGTTNPFLGCVKDRVRHHTCLMLNAWDGLARLCDFLLFEETITVPNSVEPDDTPGSEGVVVTNLNLITQFGTDPFSLNNSKYTRWRLNGPVRTPDAILILVPGFGAGANNFRIIAENLIPRVRRDHNLVLEVWGFHRRSDQLEDRAGAILATTSGKALVALDWYYGLQLGFTLHPDLVAGPNRRAVFYNTSSDIPFLANWTSGVFSRDIDVVVELARSTATNANVFLGGHSAGGGFMAQYAATDFEPTGFGPPEAGYAKLRGLVMLEGWGGSTGGTPLTSDSLDRIEAKFDGGLFGAVRDNAARCVDGTTPCTIATEATACFGQVPPKCTLPTTAYSAVAGLSPQISAAAQPLAIQALTDPNSGKAILKVDWDGPSTAAVDKVPELALLNFVLADQYTAHGLIGAFLDDDGVGASFSPAVATSMGKQGLRVGGLLTWNSIFNGSNGNEAGADHGPPPTTLPGAIWGTEREVTRLARFDDTFIAGGNTASDWYYASSGLSVTSAPGVCTAGFCSAGNVPAACTTNAGCAQSISLDSTALSVGRGRRDIVNLTQAANINIPVICFGGSNGLVPVPGIDLPFASSLGLCTQPPCNSTTQRVVDAALPNPAFPTFGNVAGGFEVYISEGFAHNDIVTAEDIPSNNVLAPLSDFIARNVVP